MDHWPLFYWGCLGCVGTLNDRLVRTVAAALRKGDARLTLDRVREHELAEASLAEMAADIVAGEQQVALTSNSREQLNSLLQMEKRGDSCKSFRRRNQSNLYTTNKHTPRYTQAQTRSG